MADLLLHREHQTALDPEANGQKTCEVGAHW
jgi:hypothetical protein